MKKPGLLDMNQHCVAAATKANAFLGCINRYIESKSWKENIPFNSALFIPPLYLLLDTTVQIRNLSEFRGRLQRH